MTITLVFSLSLFRLLPWFEAAGPTLVFSWLGIVLAVSQTVAVGTITASQAQTIDELLAFYEAHANKKETRR